MRLEVRDPVVAAIAQRTAAASEGVARLHGVGPLQGVVRRPGAKGRRSRGVDVERHAGAPVVTLRLVVVRGHHVIDVVRTVQRSVRDEVLRLAGVTAEVVVVVVDLE